MIIAGLSVNNPHVLTLIYEKRMKKQEMSAHEFLLNLTFMIGEPESVKLPLGRVLTDENFAPEPENGEVIIPGRLYFKPVDQGINIQQALEDLLDDPLITKHYVRQVIITNYIDVVGYDRLRAEHVHCSLPELLQMTEDERQEPLKFFGSLLGLEREMFPCTSGE